MAAGDLITLTDAKTWLHIKPADTTMDTLIQLLITAVSAQCLAFTHRSSFLSASYTEWYNGVGTDSLYLANGPVTAVSLVQVQGQTIPQASSPTAAGYTFDKSRVFLQGMSFGSGFRGFSLFPRGHRNVQVTYTAGYTAVPADLAMSVNEMVALKYNESNRVGEKSKSLGPSQTVSSITIADGIPEGIKMVWLRYRKLGWASAS